MQDSKLFKKFILNYNVEVKNRLVISSMSLILSSKNSVINDEERKYFRQRATEIGINITGGILVNKDSISSTNPVVPIDFSEDNLLSLKERKT